MFQNRLQHPFPVSPEPLGVEVVEQSGMELNLEGREQGGRKCIFSFVVVSH